MIGQGSSPSIPPSASTELQRLRASTEHLHFITRTFTALQLHDRHAVCDTLLAMASTFLDAPAGAILLLDRPEPLVIASGELRAQQLTDDAPLGLWRSLMSERRERHLSDAELQRVWPERPECLGTGALTVGLDVHDKPAGLMLMAAGAPSTRAADLSFMTAAVSVGALAIAGADAVGRQQELLRTAERDATAAKDFVERVTGRMRELSTGRCSLTDEIIECERDPRARAVLTGLLKLYTDWQDQALRREEAEAELRAREARFRALFDLAKVCILDCDLTRVVSRLRAHGDDLDAHLAGDPHRVRELAGHLVVHAVNKETLELFGVRSAGELVQRLPEIIADQSLPMFWQLWSALSRGDQTLELSGVVRAATGELRNVVFGVTVPDHGGLSKAIVTISDITPIHEARRAAEELARVRAQEIDRINLEVERLFHAVSHDLRAPLNAIIGLVGFAREDLQAGDSRELPRHIDTIQLRAKRLDAMLGDLLSYARVGRVTQPSERVRVDDLLQEIAGTLVPRGFELRWGTMPEVVTQRTLLAQVLLNLVANAIKHHDTGQGVIEVSAEAIGDIVEFRVADDGPGIPAKFHDRIFRMFATLRRRDEVEGSGMGLALVKKVVTSRGGEVHVEPNTPRGAIFAFTWPCDRV